MGEVDYTNWDWLPRAAQEVEAYMTRLLAESGIQPHAVSARAKSIASFQRKLAAKAYSDPMAQITDIVALRIITYSNTDRDRARELVRSRFAVLNGEDRNPGDEKPKHLRGYDCLHIVVSGEAKASDSDWVVAGGDLERYFGAFGGLEIQIRTVAGHAWAEFEHARRYKGAQYRSISAQDQGTIDQLFGAASDARRALDETFVAIDRILARPTMDTDETRVDPVIESDGDSGDVTPLDFDSMVSFLESRFPKDKDGSAQGVEFAVELARAIGIESIEALEGALAEVDSDQVRALMDSGVPTTRVRRLDDELLARFGQEYVDKTSQAGVNRNRVLQLDWRYDRLRGKTRYRSYLLFNSRTRTAVDAGPFTAVGAVREVARLIADHKGADAVVRPSVIDKVPLQSAAARPKRVPLADGSAIWVASNLNREASESLMADLLSSVRPFDLRVTRGDVIVADGQAEAIAARG